MHVRRVHQNLQPSLIIRPHGWKKGKRGEKKGCALHGSRIFDSCPFCLRFLIPFGQVVRLIRSHNVDEFFLIPILNNFKTFLPLSHMFVRWKANLVRLFSLSVILVISEKARFYNFANFSTISCFLHKRK